MRKSFVLYLPIYVFTFIWAITFYLYYLNPFHLPGIRPYTWIVLLSALGMIYIGFFTGKILSNGFSFQIFDKINENDGFPFPIKPVKKIVIVFTTLSILGIIGKYILIIQAIGGVKEYFLNPEYTRSFIIQVNIGEVPINTIIFKLFSYMATFTFPCIFLGGAIYTLPKSKLVSIYPLLIFFIASLLAFKRSLFVGSYLQWLISAFIFIYFLPKSYQKKAFITIFRQIGYFILIFLSFSLLILILRFFYYPRQLAVIINSFYFYIAGNIWLLDRYLLIDHQPLLGLSMFRSIVSWLRAFGLLEKSSIIGPHYEFYPIYNTRMNTFTFIRIPYEDFKFIGLVIISYFWGFFSFIAMRFYINKFTFIRLGIAATVTFYLFWSFYNFNWTDLTALIYRLALLSAVDIYLRRFKSASNLNVININ